MPEEFIPEEFIPKEFVTLETDPQLFSTADWNCLVVIALGILNISLFDYQIEILRHVMFYSRVCVVASRQIGKSVLIAVLAIVWALSKPDQMIVIVSSGERQAKELLTKRNFSVKKILKRQGRDNTLAYEKDYNVDPKDQIKKIAALGGMNLKFEIVSENSEEVEFANGSRIAVVPCNPNTGAGYTANLLIGDEVAKMPSWDDMRAAMFPSISRVKGKIVLFSSLRGKNHFWNITQDVRDEIKNPKGWEVLRYPIQVNPPEDIEQLKHDLPLAEYLEEFECIVQDDAHSLFPYELIEACATGSFPEWPV